MTNNDLRASKSRAWAFAIATLSVLLVVNFLHEILSRFAAYRNLYKNHAFYVPEGIDKIGGIVLCALAVWVLKRVALKGVVNELGLADSPVPALLFALAASAPMLIGFALTRSLTPHMAPLTIFFLTVLSPAAEEIEFRGLGVRVLHWQSLWYPFALHICMNLWWELFSVARSALGGWFPFALQLASIVLAILITLYWTKRKPRLG
jgi:hypothetical protein